MKVRLPGFLWWLPLGPVTEITPEEFHRWLKEDRPVQVLDARTGLEYKQGSIDGARHAPVTEMPESVERQALEKDRPVVMLCATGHRSRPGTRWLRARGYEAYSLKGGVQAWKRAGYPVKEPE